MAVQKFNGTGGKSVFQIVVAGAIGMLIRLNALIHLKVVSLGVESINEVEALGADDGVCGPAHVQIRMSFNRS